MARWARKVSATFEDMPRRLIDADDDRTKRERLEWLEDHGLSLVDFMSWRRSRAPLAALRPPSRRKFMSAKELAEFDRQREQEGESEW